MHGDEWHVDHGVAISEGFGDWVVEYRKAAKAVVLGLPAAVVDGTLQIETALVAADAVSTGAEDDHTGAGQGGLGDGDGGEGREETKGDGEAEVEEGEGEGDRGAPPVYREQDSDVTFDRVGWTVAAGSLLIVDVWEGSKVSLPSNGSMRAVAPLRLSDHQPPPFPQPPPPPSSPAPRRPTSRRSATPPQNHRLSHHKATTPTDSSEAPRGTVI